MLRLCAQWCRIGCRNDGWEKPPTGSMFYRVRSRDYLQRAMARIGDDAPAALFYAAFELRCGIEARMREYLEVWDHISKEKKQGWRIVELGKSLEKAFKGDNPVRLAMHQPETGELISCMYYTSVRKELRKRGERLGNILHAMKRLRPADDSEWDALRNDLRETAFMLRVANIGTLLGPPLMKPGTTRVQMNSEIPPGCKLGAWREIGPRFAMNVSYPTSLPDPIEPEAIVWTVS